jgi:hypothetical protein
MFYPRATDHGVDRSAVVIIKPFLPDLAGHSLATTRIDIGQVSSRNPGGNGDE